MLSLTATQRTMAALADASRLRLLALCSVGERAVGELAHALAQSEPRVSRHLKILAEAALVERRRAGHRVCYRAVTRGDSAEILRTVLARLDAGSGTLRRDAARLPDRSPTLEAPLPMESRLGRAMRECLSADALRANGARARASVGLAGALPGAERSLLLGVWHLELLEAVAQLAPRSTAVAASAAAAEVARAWLDARTPVIACDVVAAVPAASAVPGAPGAQEQWQAVVVDRTVGEKTPGLESTLAAAAAWLVPGGRLWVFERYEALEAIARAALGHPLALLRRLLLEAGFTCDRIQPLDTDGVHVLAVLATSAARGRGASDEFAGPDPVPVRGARS